jgi:hypothetical protein
MRFSDALPIQLWTADETVYNELHTDGIEDDYYFAQVWGVSDYVVVQFVNDSGKTYEIRIFDVKETLLATIVPTEAVRTSDSVYTSVFTFETYGISDKCVRIKIFDTTTEDIEYALYTFSSLDGWENEGTDPTAPTLGPLTGFTDLGSPSGASWFLIGSSSPRVSISDGQGSHYLVEDFNALSGFTYDFSYDFIWSTTGMTNNADVTVYVELLDSSNTVRATFSRNVSPGLGSTAVHIVGSIPLTPTADCTKIGIRATNNTGNGINKDLQIQSFSFTGWNGAISDWSSVLGKAHIQTNAFGASDLVLNTATLPPRESLIEFDYTITDVSGITVTFYIKDEDDNALLSQVLDNDETSIQIPITDSAIWANAVKFLFTITASTFVGGDIVDIDNFRIHYEGLTYNDAVLKSDCLSIEENPKNTVLIKYSSVKNFAGLVYEDLVDDEVIECNLRVRGIFYHEKQGVEQKDIDLSNSKTINTASSLKIQKKLLIEDCPHYMHRKIQLALQHAVSGYVKINEVMWTISDTYEDFGTRPESYPMKAASVWLTRKNYVIRNVI